MNIRLLAFDLDGTVLHDHGEVSPANLAAIEEAARQGVWTVPSTGRLFSFLPPSLLALPCIRYVVASNGAVVYDRKENTVLASRLIDTQTAVELMQLFDSFGLYYEFYTHGGAVTVTDHERYAMETLHFPESKRIFLKKRYIAEADDLKAYILQNRISPEKLNLPHVPAAVREPLLQAVRDRFEVEISSSLPDNVEINAVGVHKGGGLSVLCERLGISPEEVMVLGDSDNDLGMFRFAGWPVAMGNACDAVKAAAKAETASCEEDGAAAAIHRWILSKDPDTIFE